MIGFDLQEIEDIKDEERLLLKIALDDEIEYISKFKCGRKMRIASLWSIKEAVFKALDLKSGDISYKEIELCHQSSGKPYIRLYGKALEHFKSIGAKRIEMSLSHQKNIVGAVAIIM